MLVGGVCFLKCLCKSVCVESTPWDCVGGPVEKDGCGEEEGGKICCN